MNKVAIAKKIVSTIVGVGTSKIVHDIIENNVDADTTAHKVTVTGASAAIGMMASDATSAYTDRKIDEMIDWYKTNVAPRFSKN